MDRKMPPGQIPLTSWQFFTACRRILGDVFLQQLFKRGLRQLQRWSADPDFADTDRNPVDHYETLLRRLMELGREEVARAAVSRQARIVRCELRCLDAPSPDQSSVTEEILDDYPPLVAFHEALRNHEDPVVVHKLYQEAKREIEETYALYARSSGLGGA